MLSLITINRCNRHVIQTALPVLLFFNVTVAAAGKFEQTDRRSAIVKIEVEGISRRCTDGRTCVTKIYTKSDPWLGTGFIVVSRDYLTVIVTAAHVLGYRYNVLDHNRFDFAPVWISATDEEECRLDPKPKDGVCRKITVSRLIEGEWRAFSVDVEVFKEGENKWQDVAVLRILQGSERISFKIGTADEVTSSSQSQRRPVAAVGIRVGDHHPRTIPSSLAQIETGRGPDLLFDGTPFPGMSGGPVHVATDPDERVFGVISAQKSIEDTGEDKARMLVARIDPAHSMLASFATHIEGLIPFLEPTVDNAQRHIRLRDYNTAIRILTRILEEKGNDIKATRLLTSLYLKLGDRKQAASTYGRLLTGESYKKYKREILEQAIIADIPLIAGNNASSGKTGDLAYLERSDDEAPSEQNKLIIAAFNRFLDPQNAAERDPEAVLYCIWVECETGISSEMLRTPAFDFLLARSGADEVLLNLFGLQTRKDYDNLILIYLQKLISSSIDFRTTPTDDAAHMPRLREKINLHRMRLIRAAANGSKHASLQLLEHSDYWRSASRQDLDQISAHILSNPPFDPSKYIVEENFFFIVDDILPPADAARANFLLAAAFWHRSDSHEKAEEHFRAGMEQYKLAQELYRDDNRPYRDNALRLTPPSRLRSLVASLMQPVSGDTLKACSDGFSVLRDIDKRPFIPDSMKEFTVKAAAGCLKQQSNGQVAKDYIRDVINFNSDLELDLWEQNGVFSNWIDRFAGPIALALGDKLYRVIDSIGAAGDPEASGFRFEDHIVRARLALRTANWLLQEKLVKQDADMYRKPVEYGQRVLSAFEQVKQQGEWKDSSFAQSIMPAPEWILRQRVKNQEQPANACEVQTTKGTITIQRQAKTGYPKLRLGSSEPNWNLQELSYNAGLSRSSSDIVDAKFEMGDEIFPAQVSPEGESFRVSVGSQDSKFEKIVTAMRSAHSITVKYRYGAKGRVVVDHFSLAGFSFVYREMIRRCKGMMSLFLPPLVPY